MTSITITLTQSPSGEWVSHCDLPLEIFPNGGKGGYMRPVASEAFAALARRITSELKIAEYQERTQDKLKRNAPDTDFFSTARRPDESLEDYEARKASQA